MKDIIERLVKLVDDAQKNDNISVSFVDIKPAYKEEDLHELEEGLNIRYNDQLRIFYQHLGGLTLLWSVNYSKFSEKIPEDDIDHISGAINLLNPFDIVMSKNGNKWKGVLWFENMDTSAKQELQEFKPFDFQAAELMCGFKVKTGLLGNELFLFNINQGILSFPLSFSDYLLWVLKTKGFAYWQEFVQGKSSVEFNRFMKYMPILFRDFDSSFFKIKN